ncbi:MAG: pyrroline-5-carboxylate reductase [Clostridia bacterium]|jgi:pyrroline-5-carboxylate reductase|nr:pyrroline-5-carboxylate reductase [Clostridia bacterium]MDD4145839.1 pyrroline-5-carboxylate reductase [Clostridia bacterium]MDD4665118.1 pyrroline-5-carboxylate reductase [Clostridia bacterium]
MLRQRIGFIGGGAMGEAILKGLLTGGREAQTLLVSDFQKERREFLEKNYQVKTTAENREVVENSDVIIFAVKPQNLKEVVDSCAAVFDNKKLLISILAGITTTKLEEFFPEGSRIVRAMPNTPALVGAGTTVLSGGKFASEEDLQIALDVFRGLGSVSILPEKMLNAVTGLSGSGPAFVALIVEALADGGVMAGLPRNTALKLALDTVAGTAKLLAETGMHPAQLKDRVTSPAGTTIYGMLSLEKSGVRGTIMETVLAATKRAEEM